MDAHIAEVAAEAGLKLCPCGAIEGTAGGISGLVYYGWGFG
jgi:hypothetical protein